MSDDDLRKIAFYHRVQCDAMTGNSPIVDAHKKRHTKWAELIEAAHAEIGRLRAALKFYADPYTYEQVDVLGLCGLSDDDECSDGTEVPIYGKRARAALAAAAGSEVKK